VFFFFHIPPAKTLIHFSSPPRVLHLHSSHPPWFACPKKIWCAVPRRSSTPCSVLQPSVTSYPTVPNTPLITQFSNTLKNRSSLYVTAVSQTYKTINLFVFRSILSIITIDNEQDATILIHLLLISSTRFRQCFRPSSGAYHCNYSCPPMLLLAGIASQKPAATSVDNTRSCSYSNMLLMMGENIARNV